MENSRFKFRAWDKEFEEMVPPRLLGELIGKGIPPSITDWYEWMQYTGLKDKSGKEIYEGDIVALAGDVVADVTFSDGTFQIIPSKNNSGRSPFSQERAKRFEVIGNIYENPELMEDVK